MPTGTAEVQARPAPSSDPGRRRVRAVLVAAVLCLPGLLSLSACSDDASPGAEQASLAETTSSITTLLRKRARALLDEDEAVFTRTLSRGRIRAEQAVYFANLQQLPVQVLRYRLVADSVEPTEDGRSWWAVVETTLQLEDFDAMPVTTRDRWRFTLGDHGRRLALSSTTDRDWESENASGVQPWDLGPIRVVDRYDVLGIFDATTAGRADAVLDAVSDGRFEVAQVLPDARGEDLGTVVYVLSDATAVEGITGSTGSTVGDPERADGLTIGIRSDAGDAGSPIASYRVTLDPTVLDEDRVALDRLVRHELTHVLLGGRGRGAPLWLTEGIAEYVSVQRLAPADRRLPAVALAVGARATDLPGPEEFAGPDAEAWYAVSWWTCTYIANTYGEPMLWALLDELADGADPAPVLADRLGLTGSELVQRGVALMTGTYR